MTAITAARPCPLVGRSAALENGNALPLSLGTPQANFANPRVGCRFFDVALGISKFIYKNASLLLSHLSKRISAIFTSIYAPTAPSSPQAQGLKNAAAGGLEGAQRENKGARCLTVGDLPALPIERIFQSLAANDRIVFAMTSRAFRLSLQQNCQQRCQLLLDSDAGKHAFGRFGIKCPQGGAATLAQMKAMVARVEVIIRSMREVLKTHFPLSPAYENTAEELVWQLPPEHLQELLETAYQCNLYGLFAVRARPPAASTLGEATATIRAWLATEEARQITSLEANSEQLTCIPSEIGSLTKLEKLKLVQNQLASLPAAIGQLTGLQELLLGLNCLETLPTEFGQLTGLQVLDLNNNRFETLPTEFGQLTGLQELFLHDNRLETLPAAIGQLTKLIFLFLDNNHLRALPVEFRQLARLLELHLDNNRLETLPAEFGQLTELQGLHLDNNRFETLPAAIEQLTRLQELYLEDNRLETLPAAIGQLTGLQMLSLDNNRLETLPAEFGQLTELQGLRLRNNRLETLPAEFGQLTRLQELSLDNNRLETLPAEFRQMANLVTLELKGNPLRTIPAEIEHLPNLISLSLGPM